MVGWISGLLGLVLATAPRLIAPFEARRSSRGTGRDTRTVEQIYAKLPAMNFSRAVLARVPGRLTTIRVQGIEWTDWGTPRRVVESLRRSRCEPLWLSRVAAPA